MSSLDKKAVDDFCDKLKEFRKTLTEDQAELLDAICEAAWEVGAKVEDLERGFEGCFTPEEAGSIVAYSSGKVDLTAMIKAGMIKSSGTSMIRWTAQP